jgi:hypothetical protein
MVETTKINVTRRQVFMPVSLPQEIRSDPQPTWAGPHPAFYNRIWHGLNYRMRQQDKYLLSFLVRGEAEGCVFHAQIATDTEGENIRVVTMYTPDPCEWDEELRFRRNT